MSEKIKNRAVSADKSFRRNKPNALKTIPGGFSVAAALGNTPDDYVGKAETGVKSYQSIIEPGAGEIVNNRNYALVHDDCRLDFRMGFRDGSQ